MEEPSREEIVKWRWHALRWYIVLILGYAVVVGIALGGITMSDNLMQETIKQTNDPDALIGGFILFATSGVVFGFGAFWLYTIYGVFGLLLPHIYDYHPKAIRREIFIKFANRAVANRSPGKRVHVVTYTKEEFQKELERRSL